MLCADRHTPHSLLLVAMDEAIEDDRGGDEDEDFDGA